MNASMISKAIQVANKANVKRAKMCAIALANDSHLVSHANNRRLDGD
jgi:hypothetical protein